MKRSCANLPTRFSLVLVAVFLCMGVFVGTAYADQDYVEGEVLVVYENNVPAVVSEIKLESKGFNVTEDLPTDSVEDINTAVVAEVPENMSVEEAVNVAQNTDGVAFAQPNYVYRLDEDLAPNNLMEALATVNDAYYQSGSQSNLTLHKLPQAWNIVKTEHSVAVAVVDTGCRITHVDLAGNLDLAHAWDFSGERNQPLSTSVSQGVVDKNGDGNGHGTHVCGIVAAQANNGKGIAGSSYNATIIPIDVFDYMQDDDGSWYWSCYTSTLWTALDKVAELKETMPELKVVNMSLGGEGTDSFMNRQITALAQKGVLCVCAAGNEDTTTRQIPSDCDESLSVMALNDEGTHTYYTNYKTGRQIATNKTVSAMGGAGSSNNDRVLSAYSSSDASYTRMCGTSMATPLVSGVAAMVWAANPDLSVSEVKNILTSTADPVNSSTAGTAGKDAATAGSVNAYAAVQLAKSTSLTKVPVPEGAQGLVYNGSEQDGVLEGEGYVLSQTVAATNAGTYTAVASLSDPNVYIWADGTTANKTISWRIAPAKLTAAFQSATIKVGEAVPATVAIEGFVEGEDAQTAAGYKAPTANVSGVNANKPGKYDVTPAGGSAANYEFEYVGGSVVVMGTVVVPSAQTGLVYTGKEQTGVNANEAYTLQGHTATNAGSYIATATLLSYYTWQDGTAEPKQVAWSIAPAKLLARYKGGIVHVGDPTPDSLEITGFVNGETSQTAAGFVMPGLISTTPASSEASGYTVEPFGGSASNYTFEYVSGWVEVTDKLLVDAPVASAGLRYTGTTQVGVGKMNGGSLAATAADAGYTVSNASATNAGTYTATAHLNDGFLWSDGTSADKTFTWSIAPVELVATYNGGTMLAGASAPTGITVTGFVGGDTAATAAGYKAPVVNVTNAQWTTPGAYSITPSGGAATNYTFRYVAGKLSVFGKAVAPAGRTLTYNKATQTGVSGGTGYTLSGTVKAANAGTYVAKATLAANYKWADGSAGAKNITWRINPMSVNSISVWGIAKQAYTGKAITPVPSIAYGGTALRNGVDYTLSYANNVKAGTATVTITGRGNYNATRRVNFSIVAPSIRYRTHVQTYGNQAWKYNGAMSGTAGQAKRLEGIWIEMPSMPVSGGIQYRTHVQRIGWQGWVSTGKMAGTAGRALRLEAIQIQLTGAMASKYDVYYRVHAQKFGWMGWAKNGAQAGTAGFARRLEAIQIVLVPKGTAGPGTNYGGIRQNVWQAFAKK